MPARMATQVIKVSPGGASRKEADIAGLLFNRTDPRKPDGVKGIRSDIPKFVNGEPNPDYGYDTYPNLDREGNQFKDSEGNQYFVHNYSPYGRSDEKGNYKADGGYDSFMLADDSPYFYRVPDQSVVNKVGDFCRCGRLSLTAAQSIWFMNLFCFLAHFTMLMVTIYFANWSSKGKKDLKLKVFRIQINCENWQKSNHSHPLQHNT